MKHALLTTTALIGYAGNEGTECTTPLGRIVWGHPITPRDKTDEHNKKIIGDDGKPVQEIAYGLAIPKAEFQQFVWPFMAAEAAKGFPNGKPGKFSWKWIDGDGTHGFDEPGRFAGLSDHVPLIARCATT